MKNLLIAAFIILTVQFSVLAQDEPQAVLIDEFGKICSEDVSARYDHFMIELQNQPDAQGYVFVTGENAQDGTNLLYESFFSTIYPNRRGFDKNRITIVRMPDADARQTSFWLVPSGAEVPLPEKSVETKDKNPVKRFQRTSAFIEKYPDSDEQYPKDEFVNGFYHLGCDFAPNLSVFAEELLKDENLTGYLIIYADKKQSKKINKLANKILTKTHKVPKNRLKTIYGKPQEEPEIELWFVPKGEKPPVTTAK